MMELDNTPKKGFCNDKDFSFLSSWGHIHTNLLA